MIIQTSKNNISNLPLPDSYVVGGGDELIINVWGKIEERFTLKINQSGNIFLPKAGRVYLSGLSISKAKEQIRSKLKEHYVKFDIEISISESKSIYVYVLGNVKKPGLYAINNFDTPLSALIKAGGPKKTGSLRHIKLKRNSKTIKRFDLYNFLISGQFTSNISLQNNDVIHVPAIRETILIHGAVTQPGIYELKNDSVLKAIDSFAGGIPYFGNTLVNVQRKENNSNKTLTFKYKNKNVLTNSKVQNGDILHVYEKQVTKLSQVSITGNITQPGNYEFTKNMTLSDIINMALGFKENSFLTNIRLTRSFKNKYESFNIDYTKSSGKLFKLTENDSIEVYDANKISTQQYFHIEGNVSNPGK